MDLHDPDLWEKVAAAIGQHDYDRDGNPLDDVMAFARLFEDPEYKRVALTDISAEVSVSTVWLGIDHNFFSPGNPPFIFETMVFGGPLDQEQDRYATEAQAVAGHDQMVAKVRALEIDGSQADG